MIKINPKKSLSATDGPVIKSQVQEKTDISAASYASALVRPRITEKASALAEENVYAFEVGENATKKEIAKAVFSIYKVTPEKIRISRSPGKNVLVRGRQGFKTGVKKAYVYLKDGDKIEIV